MPINIFGAADRNAEARKAEKKAYEVAKDAWRKSESQRYKEWEFQKDNYENSLKQAEENLRFQEKGLIEEFKGEQEMRDFEFNMQNRAYDKSVSQASQQKTFNMMAADAAYRQQAIKLKEDLLTTLFEESQTFLDYKAQSTGLKMNKQNALVQADLQEAKNKAEMQFDLGSLAIKRNQQRSESQAKTQQAILEGMKAAGQIRARGTNGRTSAKSVLGVLAESGAIQAGIANGLMYAEQGIDLDIAKLQDMFILDQTMVLTAKDKAVNDEAFEQSKLEAANNLDLQKIKETRASMRERDAVIAREIRNSRMQSDMNAEASILLKPERLPALADPREVYAEYDNPETEDYVELFFRPDPVEFPEFVKTREPERDDFYMGREDVGLSNLMDGIGLAGMVAGGIGAIAGPKGSVFGMSGSTYTNIGNWLGGGSSIFGGGR